MPYFEHDGIRFHYGDTSQGIPFVFQHGLGADTTQPFTLYQPDPRIRLVAFDARGHGKTHPVGPTGKYAFDTFAGDLEALLDHLDLDRIVVGGTSMGAGISLNFTLRHPGRVLGLVLSRPAWLDEPCPFNVKIFSLITRLLREHGAKKGQEMFRQSPEFIDMHDKWPGVAENMALQFQSPQVETTAFKYERIIRDCPNRDRRQWTGIKVPTLVLANHDDPVHPFDYGETLAAAIPQAELVTITPKSTSLEQHNADVHNAVTAFLSRHFFKA